MKNTEISLQARIITIAESYDAMTIDRSYRLVLSVDEAVKEMLENSAKQFDPEVLNIFIEKVLCYGK